MPHRPPQKRPVGGGTNRRHRHIGMDRDSSPWAGAGIVATNAAMAVDSSTGEEHLCAIHRDENDDVFVLVGGVKIAKRGLPGAARATTWIILQPG
jgi:hypothetical protein